MKMKKGWVLTKLADEYVAAPTGESAEDFRGIVRLNETGKDIFQGLTEGLTKEEIAVKLTELYDGIDTEHAQIAVENVIAQLKKENVLTED